MRKPIRPALAGVTAAFAAMLQQPVTAAALPEVQVSASRLNATATKKIDAGDSVGAATSDAAALLQDVPGVSLYTAGGMSSLPAIHGLADDRLRIKLDGMDLIASCPNHMNPPLSYVAPSNLSLVQVFAGISPVSAGGDSIGGTIVAETRAPEFAAPGSNEWLKKGEVGAFYRSNNAAQGGNVALTLANERFSVSYNGAANRADNYKAGGNFKSTNDSGRPGHALALDEVGSTAFKSETHTLNFAARGDGHLVELSLGHQDVPYQLYPNQRMDMLSNKQDRVNLRYLGQYAWGSAEVQVYHEDVKHFMEFGADKQFLYTTGNTTQGMPMRTKSSNDGASAKFNIDLTATDLLRLGAEYQRYRLNDWWPAVVGSMGMGPNDFININNGERQRSAAFGEWEARLNSQWTSLLGARYEHVSTSADPIHGYNTATAPSTVSGMDMMGQKVDAVAFNNANRSKSDNNVDLTALARYVPSATTDVELGLARKVRSPNLYERYTWSTAGMMAIMNNVVGDGNGYVGNPNLKPETAYTLSATLDLHAVDRRWEFKATPYYTHVNDYIDAIRCPTGAACTAANSTTNNRFVVLQYANQSARLYGVDLSGRLPLATTSLGDFGLKGQLTYTRGENRDTGGNLYNIMPLNAKLALTQQWGGWNNSLEVVAVAEKHNTSAVRNEIQTAGYSLTNLRASYAWNKTARVDFGIENLFDKFYYLPLGGAYSGQGKTMSINGIPWGIGVPGMGRSLYAGLNFKF